MKLFKVKSTHFAQRGSHEAIDEFIVANNDREVFKYLDKKHSWKEIMDEDIEYDPEGENSYRNAYNSIYAQKGDYERDLSDLYYGATIYGWEEVELKDDSVIALMVINGLAKVISGGE
jgi:hypothetical protein